MVSKKKTTKEVIIKQEKNEEFVKLAHDLKDIILDLNQRVSELESIFKRIRTRLGV